MQQFPGLQKYKMPIFSWRLDCVYSDGGRLFQTDAPLYFSLKSYNMEDESQKSVFWNMSEYLTKMF